jgi:hypothetical protein
MVFVEQKNEHLFDYFQLENRLKLKECRLNLQNRVKNHL